MAGRNPHEAVQNFLDPLQKATSCVTRSILNIPKRKDDPKRNPHVVILGDGDRVPLGRRTRLALTVMIHYQIVQDPDEDRGPWKTSITAYYYGFDRWQEDAWRELLSYQWHPGGKSPVQFPHVHLGYGSRAIDQIKNAHLPTGRVSFEEVIRLAITDLGVTPLRKDWADVLQRTQFAFERYRTWPK